MKKIILLVLSLLLLGQFAFSSGGSEGSSKSSDRKYVLRMGIVSSAGHTHNIVIEEWAKKVLEDTNGKLEIRLLGSGQLGGERDYIEGMQLGTIDMAQVSAAIMSNFLPDFNVMSLPYVFDSYESIDKIVTGDIGNVLFEELENINLVGLTWFSNGFRSIFTNISDVSAPKDLKGAKIRVMENQVMINSLDALGASATPMAYSELYTSIQQGVVDGGENSPINIISDKFYEVSPELILTEHFATPGVVMIGKKSFDKLPADLQSYLKKSALELGTKERELDKQKQANAVDELKAKGMNITKVNKDEFKKAALSVYPGATEKVSPKVIDLLKETLNIDF